MQAKEEAMESNLNEPKSDNQYNKCLVKNLNVV